MRCIKCRKELSEGTRFCSFCGEKIADQAPETPLYQTEVKGLLKSGRLIVYSDRTEFELSKVQKMTFRYDSIAAVKKSLDRINFVMEDGRTESCTVNRKNIHEAFFTIEQACRPYLAERNRQLAADGIRYSFPSSRSGLNGILGSGLLNILDDRCEYVTPSGKNETVSYQDVKAVRSSAMGTLEFCLYDGTKKAFTAEKELRDEIVAFLRPTLQPFIEERKARLLSEGIYFSFPNSRGVLNIFEDRLEYASEAGAKDRIEFRDIRAVSVSGSTLETALTNGTAKTFPIDKDFQDELLPFLEAAIAPFTEERTKGFDTAFGLDEKLEVNEARGIFHLIRQGGKEISGEYGLRDIIKAEAVDTTAGRPLAGILRGAKNSEDAAGNTDERISNTGILLTVRTEQGTETIPVCFSSFTFGISRSAPEYERCEKERGRFFAYMESHHPDCELIPLLPDGENEPSDIPAAALESADADAGDSASAPADGRQPKPSYVGTVEKEQFGTLIEGVSDFVQQCGTPMTIAIQGDWETGSNGFIRMVYNNLDEYYRGNVVWLYTWQFSQFDLGEQLPMLLADKLIELLGGSINEEAKLRAKMLAQGVIGIASGLISQGGSDGKKLSDAIFKDNLANSLEQKVRLFSDLVKRKVGGTDGKIIVFVDDLNRLAPAKAVELLDAMRCFFDCPGCIFMVAIDRDTILRGKQALNGAEYSEEKGEAYFNKVFRTTFHVPKSHFNIKKYIMDNIERIHLHTDGDEEILHYTALASLSVGGDPKALERLFNSFLLLKSLSGEEAFADGQRRLILFALLCMQSRFPDVYQCLRQKKTPLTPEFLLSLPAGSGIEEAAKLDDSEREDFRAFAEELLTAINTDGREGISDRECGAFAQALAISSITSSR